MGVELLVADESTWLQFMRVSPGWKPPTTPGLDTRTPFIADRQSWSATIAAILKTLKQGEKIHYLRIMGHGSSGQVTCGSTLRFNDLSAIAEFKKLEPYCSTAMTRLQIVGCEVAAEGPCLPGTIIGVQTPQPICMGPFTGNTSMPGYLLLRRLASTISAPAIGSPWKQAMVDGWEVRGARLTVGPEGHWTYDPKGANGQTKMVFGAP